MKPWNSARLAIACAVTLLCSACVTHIRPTVTGNPPPQEALADFQHFLLQPTQVSAAAADETKAIGIINTYINERVRPKLASWENRDPDGRTLVIQPQIRQLKFVGGTARFFAGAMAGSSAVLMRVKFTDAANGHVIADPEFYQRASATGGAFTIGGTDHGMLARIVTVMQQYLARNYQRPVGGPTGLEDEADNGASH